MSRVLMGAGLCLMLATFGYVVFGLYGGLILLGVALFMSGLL